MKKPSCYLMIYEKLVKTSVQNLKELLKKLLEEQVDFVLIGGFAGVVYGSTMVTQDLDICAALTSSNIDRLKSALKNLSPKHRMNPSFKPSLFDFPQSWDGIKNVYLETDIGILDILSSASPVGDFAEIKSRAITIDLYGFKCHVISIDDLIEIKSTMKRPKDIQALQELKTIRDQIKK